jgi:hypothetical protein
MAVLFLPHSNKSAHENALIISSVALQIAFHASISGVDVSSNVRIIGGLALQTFSGVLLMKVFFVTSPLPTPTLLGGGFVLGVIPVLLINFSIAGSLIYVAGLSLACFYIVRRQPLNLNRIVLNQSTTEDSNFVKLSLAIVLSNFVFLRFHHSAIGILVLLLSIGLAVIPKRFLIYGHWIYLFFASLAIVQRSLRGSTFQVFTRFRYGPDWVIEQGFARSLASSSFHSPFFWGDSISYHFLSQMYWGRFEEIFNIKTFAFSVPGLLTSSLIATTFLLLDSPPGRQALAKSTHRIVFLAVLFGSWPFSDTFAMDMFSRSQSLSLAFCSLIVLSVSENSKRVWLLLLPILVTMTSLTKVSTGLFSCLLIGSYAWFQSVRVYKQHHRISLKIPGLRNQIAGTGITALTVTGAIVIVFYIPKSFASYSGLEFALTFPEAHDTTFAVLTWIQRVVAFLPLLALVVAAWTEYRKNWTNRSDSMSVALLTAILLAVAISLSLSSDSGIPFNGYMIGLSAPLGGLLLFDSCNRFWSRLPSHRQFLILMLVTGLSLAFVILERRNQPSRFGSEAIVAIAVVIALATLLVAHHLKSVKVAIVVITVLVSFSNSLGQVLARWTIGTLGLSTIPNPADVKFQSYQNVIKFLSSVDRKSVFATDNEPNTDSEFSHDAQLLLGSAPFQMWAEPRFSQAYLAGSPLVEKRLETQRLLSESPTRARILEAKLSGVTHLILFQRVTRASWRSYLSNQGVSIGGVGDFSTIVFEDTNVQVIRL